MAADDDDSGNKPSRWHTPYLLLLPVGLCVGAHEQLLAVTPELLSLVALLDDPALVVERGEVLLDGQLFVLQLDGGTEVTARLLEIEQRVAEPAHTPVELQDGAPGLRTARADLAECLREIVGTRDVQADRVRYVLLGEDAPFDPRNAYATSKVAQEFYASNWARVTGGSVAAMRCACPRCSATRCTCRRWPSHRGLTCSRCAAR